MPQPSAGGGGDRGSRTLLTKLCQQQHFAAELDALEVRHCLNQEHYCRPTTICGWLGLLRVGGRLGRSNSHFGKRHPVILHRSSHFTKLLVRHLHLSSNHAGPTTLMGLLCDKYHVMGAKQVVREVSPSCIICRKVYARTATQLMGQLPSARVNPGIPFQEVGTDFAGPILLRQGYTRKPVTIKGFICLFICMATKAVHLEPVTDLTTEAFLACLQRFVSLKQACQNLFRQWH